jgi:hypothetical protein
MTTRKISACYAQPNGSWKAIVKTTTDVGTTFEHVELHKVKGSPVTGEKDARKVARTLLAR